MKNQSQENTAYLNFLKDLNDMLTDYNINQLNRT
ncbi:hypothetical protein HME9304_03100 [Flagellimonas maritima]|uniref:Uncharacterized protein n=1 Tax=Flagellimonas maritima TaxID=1383885 RepID=A0A2Z4LXH4_9FLAO|nr:hypothetical protein HME9304_03100 [Allomuricauda aurantiaca]